MIEVKAGYKQTEIGVIPEDWDVKPLGELVKVKDGTHQTPKYFDSGIPFYSVESVTNNDFTNIKYISETEHKLLTRKFKIEEMDILMTRIGSIGDCKLITWSPNASFYVSLALLKPKNKLNAQYIYHFSKTAIFKKELEDRSLQLAIPKKINLGEISKVKICIPKELPEQTAIATVLSDTDALIERLEKLIAKKKAIKQGTKQQILTGKKRLPGFEIKKGSKQTELGVIPEDWDVCDLSEAVDFLDGKRRPVKSIDRAKISGIYPYYGASGIVDYVNDYIFDDDLILLGEDGENILSRNLPLAFRVMGKMWVNNHAHVLKPKDLFNIVFLTNYLESLDYSLLNSGTAQPKLNKSTCLKIKIAKPTKSEQNAIATILSDMDTEIEALKQNRDKYTMIKQGMMQQLLTGRIRIHGTN